MKKWCLVILTLMLCGCSTAPKTAETEAVKYDRPVLRTEAGSNEKNFTVFAMDTVMQFQLYGGNDEVEEKVREQIEELEEALGWKRCSAATMICAFWLVPKATIPTSSPTVWVQTVASTFLSTPTKKLIIC